MSTTSHSPVALLYDGQCGLCLRSARTIRRLDWLGHVESVNFRNEEERLRVAPDITLEDLDTSMHIRMATGETFEGFYAFRRLAWHLPLCWVVAPLLYIPGVPFVGTRIYSHIAARRKRCTHEQCAL